MTLNFLAFFIQVLAKQNRVVVELLTFTLKERRLADFLVDICLFVFVGLLAGLACEPGLVQNLLWNPTEFHALEWLSAVWTVFFRF